MIGLHLFLPETNSRHHLHLQERQVRQSEQLKIGEDLDSWKCAGTNHVGYFQNFKDAELFVSIH